MQTLTIPVFNVNLMLAQSKHIHADASVGIANLFIIAGLQAKTHAHTLSHQSTGHVARQTEAVCAIAHRK